MKIGLKGVAFVAGTFLTGIVGCAVCASAAILLVASKLQFVPKSISFPLLRIHHRICDTVAGLWFLSCGFLHEAVFGVKITYSVDLPTGFNSDETVQQKLLNEIFKAPPPGKFNIIMMNHRTRLDWMLFWAFLSRVPFSGSASLKIALKKPLSRVPIFGYAMQTFRFLFLNRKWEDDERHLKDFIEYYKMVGTGANLLIFPEGSDLSEENLEKSQEYARKNGLPQYRKVLNPRTTGMEALRKFIGEENINCIIDVTNGYTDFKLQVRPSEASLFSGEMPRKLHYYIRPYTFLKSAAAAGGDSGSSSPAAATGANGPLASWSFKIPPTSTTEGAFPKWIQDRFHEKEALLEEFYRQNPVQFVKYGRGVSPAPLLTRYLVVMGVWSFAIVQFFRVLFFSSNCSMGWLWCLTTFGSAAVFTKLGGVDHLFLYSLVQAQGATRSPAGAKKSD